MHQIAFADDANQLALIVYDGRGADPPLQKDLWPPLLPKKKASR